MFQPRVSIWLLRKIYDLYKQNILGKKSATIIFVMPYAKNKINANMVDKWYIVQEGWGAGKGCR